MQKLVPKEKRFDWTALPKIETIFIAEIIIVLPNEKTNLFNI